MNFTNFKTAVSAQIQKMIDSGNTLLVVDFNGHALAEAYVDAFRPEDNRVYRERREHDCNCCKAFIRKVGSMVTVIDGELVSIWDIEPEGVHKGYLVVAEKMATMVKAKPIANMLRLQEASVGTDHNFELSETDEPVRWEHFHHVMPEEYVVEGTNHPLNLVQNHKIALENSMNVSYTSLEIVADLIASDSIYRGNEKAAMITQWAALHEEFNSEIDPNLSDFWLWDAAYNLGEFAAFRGTAIGQLVDNISKGDELDAAVAKYEKMVAPENYKRSTSVVTKGMVDKAMKRVQELGIEPALTRRAAMVSDITINNVLFADSSVKEDMGVFAAITGETKTNVPNLDKIDEISIEDFIANVLPKIDKLEVMMENKHSTNLVSLVAPVDFEAGGILKWGNNFSWSYNGELTDSSMRDNVKKAGGSVDGDVRFSIQWNEEQEDKQNDLDAHCRSTQSHIYFSNKIGKCTGRLDVDVQRPRESIAVENITWANLEKMPDGVYQFYVNNYAGTNTKGFRAEVEILGEVHTYEYNQSVRKNVNVATITKKNGEITLKNHLDSSVATKELWGIHTQQFTKVETVMYSPNHWDGESTGNKHFFFMLEGCKNPEPVRGLYNEFLHSDLHEDRKVFEVLGAKLKAPYSDEQLSGLGFSETQRNELVVKTSGSFNRVLKIKF